MQLQLTICCRYDVNQSNIRYSDVKQSLSRDSAIKDSTIKDYVKPSEPEYEAIVTNLHCDVEMNLNPAYQACDIKMDINPAYQATSQSCKKSS